MPLTILPAAFVVRSVFQRHLTLSIWGGIAPLTFVHSSIFEMMSTLTKTAAIFPFAFVSITIGIIHDSMTVGFTVTPFSIVPSTIFPCDGTPPVWFTYGIKQAFVHSPTMFRDANPYSFDFASCRPNGAWPRYFMLRCKRYVLLFFIVLRRRQYWCRFLPYIQLQFPFRFEFCCHLVTFGGIGCYSLSFAKPFMSSFQRLHGS
mmetsp:Transcript_15547/g.23519  ORF Transcript_15547/g.23519 Transcript_15547/m.23519 type:complete len:203 (+) Transcript_15547:617-1225(+)